MKTFASRLGFWSAVVATLLLAVAGPTATASIQPLATVVGFLLTPSFLIVMACIYCYAPEEEGGKVLSKRTIIREQLQNINSSTKPPYKWTMRKSTNASLLLPQTLAFVGVSQLMIYTDKYINVQI